MTPADRAMLDRRISDERLIPLDPPFAEPDWAWQLQGLSAVPIVFVMDGAGQIGRRWHLADEVDWSRAAAVRIETPWGKPLTLDDICVDEWDYA